MRQSRRRQSRCETRRQLDRTGEPFDRPGVDFEPVDRFDRELGRGPRHGPDQRERGQAGRQHGGGDPDSPHDRHHNRSSKSAFSSAGSDQLCDRMIRASATRFAGTWSLTPRVATGYIPSVPIRSPSRNVGMPSASSRSGASRHPEHWEHRQGDPRRQGRTRAARASSG